MSSRKTTQKSEHNRRTVIAGAAACAALATVPALAVPVDPIFAAIDAHSKAAQTMDRLIAAKAPSAARYAAMDEEFRVGNIMILDTAPTTRAGLRALEVHLRDPRNWGALFMAVVQPELTAGRLPASIDSRENAKFVIAKRTAELAAA
jgi:hypothetical protein